MFGLGANFKGAKVACLGQLRLGANFPRGEGVSIFDMQVRCARGTVLAHLTRNDDPRISVEAGPPCRAFFLGRSLSPSHTSPTSGSSVQNDPNPHMEIFT